MANALARALRKTLTPQEVKLWVNLRALRPQGFHIRRQSPLGPYVVDFLCKTRKLVIEVDGSQHASPQGRQHDDNRDQFLHARGYRVLRFWNTDIDTELDGTMRKIIEALQDPTPVAAQRPPPLVGRDR